MYKIEKGVAITKETKGRKRIYPFNDMAIGDSFFVPVTDILMLRKKQASIVGGARRITVQTRIVYKNGDNNGELLGLRVWRIA